MSLTHSPSQRHSQQSKSVFIGITSKTHTGCCHTKPPLNQLVPNCCHSCWPSRLCRQSSTEPRGTSTHTGASGSLLPTSRARHRPYHPSWYAMLAFCLALQPPHTDTAVPAAPPRQTFLMRISSWQFLCEMLQDRRIDISDLLSC